jgi:hypothetical protein
MIEHDPTSKLLDFRIFFFHEIYNIRRRNQGIILVSQKEKARESGPILAALKE